MPKPDFLRMRPKIKIVAMIKEHGEIFRDHAEPHTPGNEIEHKKHVAENFPARVEADFSLLP